MKFPKYWVKTSVTASDPNGKELTLEAYGWSTVSLDEARQLGEQRARRAIEAGLGAGKKRDYEYGNAPFREEIVEKLQVEGSDVGIISRNRYGALVLNTAQVMFVDIDLPEPKPDGFIDSILSIFSSKRTKEKLKRLDDAIVDRIGAWQANNSRKSARLYRTHSGFRLLFTDDGYDPVGSETKRILEELGSDPLYRRLTEKQECFRARLTPKPWRCGASRPPSRFPWDNSTRESQYRDWEKGYHEKIKDFSTCVFLQAYGNSVGNAVIKKVQEIHDTLTLGDGRPLA